MHLFKLFIDRIDIHRATSSGTKVRTIVTKVKVVTQ